MIRNPHLSVVSHSFLSFADGKRLKAFLFIRQISTQRNTRDTTNCNRRKKHLTIFFSRSLSLSLCRLSSLFPLWYFSFFCVARWIKGAKTLTNSLHLSGMVIKILSLDPPLSAATGRYSVHSSTSSSRAVEIAAFPILPLHLISLGGWGKKRIDRISQRAL